MKKLFYILALFIGFCSSVYAQKAKLSKEEFRNIQEKFITEKANLTTKAFSAIFSSIRCGKRTVWLVV